MNNTIIRKIIKHTCNRCGVPELAKGIEVVRYDKFTDVLADAEYFKNTTGIIRLGTKWWNKLSTHQKYELVIHEVCHIIADYAYPQHCDDFHGYIWKSLMRCAGISKPRASIYL